MIYLNNDINELLNNIAPSKYEISTEGAILHMIEQSKFVRAINRAIDLDYNTLREETTYGELKDAFYSRNFFKFVFKLIDALIGIIAKGIKVIAAITKKFLYRASEVDKSNTEFLKKYGDKLDSIKNITVSIDNGYKINENISDISLAIESISYDFFSEAKSLLMKGKLAFANEDDITNKIINARCKILSNLSYNSDAKSLIMDRYWRDEIKNACFGDKTVVTYSVDTLMDVIKSFDKSKNFVKILSSKVTGRYKTDIDELNGLKKIMQGNPAYSNNTELIEQFKLLNTYRTQTMNDVIYTYETLLLYIDQINTQSKAMCIKALQAN